MAYRVSSKFIDGPAGGVVTLASAIGASQISAPNGGSISYASESAFSAPYSGKFICALNSQSLARWTPASPSLTMSLGLPFVVAATPAANATWFATMRYASGYVARFQWTSANTIQVTDLAGGNILNILTNATPGAGYWLSVGLIVATATTGYILAEIYNWQGVLLGSATSPAYNLGTTAVVGGDFGIVNTNATAGTTVYIDDVQFNDGSSKGIKPPQIFTAQVGFAPSAALSAKASAIFNSSIDLALSATVAATTQITHGSAVELYPSAQLQATAAGVHGITVELAPSVALQPAAHLESSMTVELDADMALGATANQQSASAANLSVVAELGASTSMVHQSAVALAAEMDLTADAFMEMFGVAELRALMSLTAAGMIELPPVEPVGEERDIDIVGTLLSSPWHAKLAHDTRFSASLEPSPWHGELQS